MNRLAWLLAAMVWAVSSQGQVLYSSLTGNVADPSKAAIPGAEVKLVNTLTGVTQRTQTDSQGVYRFNNIQSGTYEVECTAEGFRGYRRTGIEAPANEVVRVDVGWRSGETQSVVVTAESALLQTDNSDVHTDMGTKELTDLPVDGYRNYQSLLGLVPGVTPPVDSNSIAGNPAGSFVNNVNGTSQSNNNTRVDGASNTTCGCRTWRHTCRPSNRSGRSTW
jgi:hypothetical protein